MLLELTAQNLTSTRGELQSARQNNAREELVFVSELLGSSREQHPVFMSSHLPPTWPISLENSTLLLKSAGSPQGSFQTPEAPLSQSSTWPYILRDFNLST